MEYAIFVFGWYAAWYIAISFQINISRMECANLCLAFGLQREFYRDRGLNTRGKVNK